MGSVQQYGLSQSKRVRQEKYTNQKRMSTFADFKVSHRSYPGDLRSGYLFSGFPDYWLAPDARSHLHVPGVTGTGEVCLKFIPRATPLNVGELKV